VGVFPLEGALRVAEAICVERGLLPKDTRLPLDNPQNPPEEQDGWAWVVDQGYLRISDSGAREDVDIIRPREGGYRRLPIAYLSEQAEADILVAIQQDPEAFQTPLHKRPGVFLADGNEVALDWHTWDRFRSAAWRRVEAGEGA
jgi:hypothetical protein